MAKRTKKRKASPAILVRMDEGLVSSVEEAAQRARVSREGWVRQLIEDKLGVVGERGFQRHRHSS